MIFFFITVILWISFIPAPITDRYKYTIYLVLIICLICSFIRFKNVRYFLNDKFDKLIWLFLMWNFFSALFAYDKNMAFERYVDFTIPFVAIYFIARNELNNKRIRLLIYVLFFAGVTVGVMAILEFIFKSNIIYEKLVYNPFYRWFLFLSRAMSTMIHPTILGTYLACCLPCYYFIAGVIKNKTNKLLAMLGAFFIFIGLMVTFSRTSWIVALTGAFFYFYKKNKKLLPIMIVFISLFSVAVFGIMKLKPTLRDRIDYKNADNYIRLERYPLTMKMIKDHPFVGVGLNNYRIVFDKYYGPNQVDYNIKIPDNMYLMIAGESGLIGAGLFLLLLFYIIKRGFVLLKDKEDKNWEMTLTLFSVIICILIHMISYELFYWTVPFFLFLLLLGGLLSYPKYKISRCIKTPDPLLPTRSGLLQE
ncbi:MAG: hypothetical protein A2047_00375 [Omnitrophica bacterium GWA2_41_15]|nr:MAG: hypothetical protein A2047_00375 [Omnitrophica bacterium GWA2_41_15]HAZ10981.1 hypothetical protein [Candidatus Omnitrophota bacterium]